MIAKFFSYFAVLMTMVGSLQCVANTLTMKHALGTIELSATPQRVVVIGAGPLDVLDVFGIKPVGVPKSSTLPAYLEQYKDKQYANVGSYFEPDYEAIFTLKPDLILIGPRSASNYEKLSKIAPTYLYQIEKNAGYWQSTQQQWENMGELFDRREQVKTLIQQTNQNIKRIHDYTQQHKLNALTVMASGGNVTTFGSRSRFSAIYQEFGFLEATKSLAEKTHGDLISYEFIRDKNPQTLFILDRDKLENKGTSHTAKNFDNPLVQSTNAYQHQRIITLNLDAWYLSIAGMTATKLMIADINNVIKE